MLLPRSAPTSSPLSVNSPGFAVFSPHPVRCPGTESTFTDLSSHVFESTDVLSWHTRFLLPCFPSFLFPLPFFQFEGPAGNIALSGARPGMAAQLPEVARHCETVTSSRGPGHR